MPQSDAGANQMLDSGLPATVYTGLSSTLPTAAGGNITEPSGNGYARESTTMGAASGRTRSNTNAINFTAAGGDWGVQAYTVYFDALSGGTFLGWDDLTASRNMVDGAQIDIAIGDIDFTL